MATVAHIGDSRLYRYREGLLEQLQAADDAAGFRKPFAALALSEVARSDRVEPVFTGEQREQLVAAAAAYLGGVRDYRGFSETEGWRHGVAHNGDGGGDGNPFLDEELSVEPKLAHGGMRAKPVKCVLDRALQMSI